jgi:hypothetical protein
LDHFGNIVQPIEVGSGQDEFCAKRFGQSDRVTEMRISSTRDNVSVESMLSDMIADFVEGRLSSLFIFLRYCEGIEDRVFFTSQTCLPLWRQLLPQHPLSSPRRPMKHQKISELWLPLHRSEHLEASAAAEPSAPGLNEARAERLSDGPRRS